MGKGNNGTRAAPPLKMDAITGDHPKPTVPAKDFMWRTDKEPHAERKKAIVAAHPEVKELFGYDPMTKYYVVPLVLFQIAVGLLMKDTPFWSWKFWIVAYVIGGTATQAIFLAIHEVTHGLAFKKFQHNKLLCIFTNLPIGLPYCAAFRGYHMEHHRYQGHDGIDTDIPTLLEGLFFTNVLTKTLFCINQILFYALRPMLVRQQTFTKWHLLNWAVQFTFDALVVHYFGWTPILYFLLSDYLAGSLHPCASHFIAEHYVFVEGIETYSYYGILNKLCFNVGYHNEHHDFPNIPWTRLPKLREIAPEFYDTLPYHESWVRVLWQFITDNTVSGRSRIKRAKGEAAKTKAV